MTVRSDPLVGEGSERVSTANAGGDTSGDDGQYDVGGNRRRNAVAGSRTKPSGPKVTVNASKNPDCPKITAVP